MGGSTGPHKQVTIDTVSVVFTNGHSLLYKDVEDAFTRETYLEVTFSKELRIVMIPFTSIVEASFNYRKI